MQTKYYFSLFTIMGNDVIIFCYDNLFVRQQQRLQEKNLSLTLRLLFSFESRQIYIYTNSRQHQWNHFCLVYNKLKFSSFIPSASYTNLLFVIVRFFQHRRRFLLGYYCRSNLEFCATNTRHLIPETGNIKPMKMVQKFTNMDII